MKENLKSKRGITLIALIITIIILLILAMVTINILINQGIIGHANNAVRGYEVAEEKELMSLAYQNYKMDKVKNEDAQLFVDGANGGNPIPKEDKGWIVTFDKTGHKYELQENGTISSYVEPWVDNGDGTYTKDGTTIKIGDYVGYTYDTKESGYSIKAKHSGYTSDQTIKQPSTALQWRILKVENDKVTLVSDKSTSNTVTLNGSLGYNNGVYLLDDACANLFSNSTLGATARSMDREDIEAQMNESGLSARAAFKSGGSIQYGEKHTFKNKDFYYPNIYAQEAGQGINADDISTTGRSASDPVYSTPTEETYSAVTGATDSDKKITAQQTYYFFIDRVTMSSLAKAFKNGTGNIIFTGGSFWLATREVDCSIGDIGFLMGSVTTGSLTIFKAEQLFSSGSHPQQEAYGLRPVVELPNGIKINTDGKDGKSAATAYTLTVE